jgi:hypothetical protein
MISVREILRLNSDDETRSIQGYLVVIDGQIRLLDQWLCQEWKTTPYVTLKVEDLKFALMLQLAQMGGGDSLFFHDAIVSGVWDGEQILPNLIHSKDSKQEDWREIDFSPDIIAKGKKKFGHLDQLKKEHSGFWSSEDHQA